MSLTLHTTEIWVKTGTDSGGMKDRTHGIFSGSASNTGHKQAPRSAASLPRSEIRVTPGSLRFSPQQACSRSVLGFETEADPGTWCRAGGWDCVIYEEAPEVEGVAASAAGTGCWPLPFLESKFEPERDQACPASWLQGFSTLACYHRSEL